MTKFLPFHHPYIKPGKNSLNAFSQSQIVALSFVHQRGPRVIPVVCLCAPSSLICTQQPLHPISLYLQVTLHTGDLQFIFSPLEVATNCVTLMHTMKQLAANKLLYIFDIQFFPCSTFSSRNCLWFVCCSLILTVRNQ